MSASRLIVGYLLTAAVFFAVARGAVPTAIVSVAGYHVFTWLG